MKNETVEQRLPYVKEEVEQWFPHAIEAVEQRLPHANEAVEQRLPHVNEAVEQGLPHEDAAVEQELPPRANGAVENELSRLEEGEASSSESDSSGLETHEDVPPIAEAIEASLCSGLTLSPD
ncbi:hypothetical protein PF008_g2114 [Phytophthora fragariae]|uniref:Uncharacterized protein n=1 Tax=Phytophthora fragariae TaxID=53985 RepID=A0A6G0SJ61_9STRA|nr:hypothetical protein PF008_g2114 [Phytophthora fragariae]